MRDISTPCTKSIERSRFLGWTWTSASAFPYVRTDVNKSNKARALSVEWLGAVTNTSRSDEPVCRKKLWTSTFGNYHSLLTTIGINTYRRKDADTGQSGRISHLKKSSLLRSAKRSLCDKTYLRLVQTFRNNEMIHHLHCKKSQISVLHLLI